MVYTYKKGQRSASLLNSCNVALLSKRLKPYGLLHGGEPRRRGHFLLPCVNGNRDDGRGRCGWVEMYVS